MFRIGLIGFSILLILGVFIGVGILFLPKPAVAGAICAVLAVPFFFLIPLQIAGVLLSFPPFFLVWRAGGISPLELAYSVSFFGILFATGLKYISDHIFKEHPRSLYSPILWPLVLFLILVVFSSLNSILRGREFLHWASDLNALYFYGMYFILGVWVRQMRTLNRLFYIIIIASVVGTILSAFLALLNIQWHPGIPYSVVIFDRSVKKLGLPTPAGMVAFLTTLSLAISLDRSYKKRLFTILSTFFALEQLTTFVRSWWVGDIAGIALILMLMPPFGKNKVFKTIMLLVLCICILVMIAMAYPVENPLYKLLTSIEKRFYSIFISLEEPAITTRISEWRQAFKKALESPIFGNGLGTSIRFYRYDYWYGWRGWETTRYIHNSYIYFFLNMGILGLVGFIWLSISFLRYGIETARACDDPFYRGLAVGFTASFLGALTASIFGPMVNSPIMTIWFGFMIGGIFLIDMKVKGKIE